ncbi:hypothetical protein TNCV_2038861 [Trichonephila clavipes]|nr:hypothetical protein TNCV_2038861 [Trichonephila clavipes]
MRVCLSCGPNGFCLVLMFLASSLLSPVGDIALSRGMLRGLAIVPSTSHIYKDKNAIGSQLLLESCIKELPMAKFDASVQTLKVAPGIRCLRRVAATNAVLAAINEFSASSVHSREVCGFFEGRDGFFLFV